MSLDERTATVALLGCGHMGTIIADGLRAGLAGPYRVIAVCNGSRFGPAVSLAERIAAKACTSLDDVLSMRPNYVVEAANVAALRESVIPCLQHGADVLALSTSAFVDKSFAEELTAAGRSSGKNVYVCSGSLGGQDLVQAAALAGELRISMMTETPARGLVDAPALDGATLPSTTTHCVFHGTGLEAVHAFPENVNFIASLGLAAGDLDRIGMTVLSNPWLKRIRHSLHISGAFGVANLQFEVQPFPEHPKSGLLAAYSVLAKLRSLAQVIQF